MIRHNPDNKFPSMYKTAYIDSTATIIGNVKIGKNVFIGPGAVIRADEPNSSIVVKDNCNIQDRVIIHALENSSVLIGKNSSLAHGCIVHGPAKIGKNCFIGFGSVVFKAEIDSDVVIKHLAVIEKVNIPKHKFISNGEIINRQDKVKNLRCTSKETRQFCQQVVKTNLELNQEYLKKQ